MSRPRDELRYLQVVTLRESGRTYQEIGDRLEPPISHQRVAEILRAAGRSDLCNRDIMLARIAERRHPCRTCGTAIPPYRVYCSTQCDGLDHRKSHGYTAKAEAALPLRAKGLSWEKIARIVHADKWALYSVCKRLIRSQGMNPDEHWAFYRLRPPGRPARRRRTEEETRP